MSIYTKLTFNAERHGSHVSRTLRSCHCLLRCRRRLLLLLQQPSRRLEQQLCPGTSHQHPRRLGWYRQKHVLRILWLATPHADLPRQRRHHSLPAELLRDLQAVGRRLRIQLRLSRVDARQHARH